MVNFSDLRAKREEGFTLVEMMVVVLVVGILVAIAIPAVLNQKKAAVDSEVKSDLKSAVMAVERWFVSHPNGIPTQAVISNIKKDKETTLTLTGIGDGEYIIKGTNPKGNTSAGTGFEYNSLTDTL